jgi:pimeloyl-ACP methyl ester carboxylesterase
VNGHDDIMVPSINSFILQQYIPNATLIIYPDSGHGARRQGAVEARQIPLIWHVAL